MQQIFQSTSWDVRHRESHKTDYRDRGCKQHSYESVYCYNIIRVISIVYARDNNNSRIITGRCAVFEFTARTVLVHFYFSAPPCPPFQYSASVGCGYYIIIIMIMDPSDITSTCVITPPCVGRKGQSSFIHRREISKRTSAKKNKNKKSNGKKIWYNSAGTFLFVEKHFTKDNKLLSPVLINGYIFIRITSKVGIYINMYVYCMYV